ncbi:MAG: phospho-sugar mutase [Erysipelotrichaceae bacterium]|nr:phospho-sugar mutase [Erysipelotrichaceae bacterium]MBQ3963557.1 phospho-sugar mutase [Erysipelotrichaceae bacterium]
MDYREKYEQWLNHPNLVEEVKKQLREMTDQQIKDAFYTDVAFGTAGMRGLMGYGPNRLNIYTIRKATQGFANYLNHNNKHSVAIAYDNRYNSKDFAFDCAKLLASNGIEVYIFDSLRPTPELSYTVRYFKCDGGIMITASHNPKEYNGYKLYDETGCQLIPEIAEQVIAEISKLGDMLGIKPAEDYDESLIHVVNKEVDDAYYADCLSIQLRKDVDKNFKIAFSPEHGASYHPVMDTLKMAGYDVVEVASQSVPDPAFGATKTPNPEEPGAYEEVLKLAKEIDAKLLLVCDPDGDRMGVGIKQGDEYIVLNGNQTGALLLEYILSTHEDLGIKVENPCMFNTVVTSDIGEAIARYHGCDNERTLTGFKYIGNKVRQYEKSHEKNYVFGYEESYGSLIKPFVRDKDATQACLMLAEACAYYLGQGKTLMDVMNEAYEKVGYYYDTQFSIMLPGADGAVKLQEIMTNIRNNPLQVPGFKTLKIEDYKLQKVYEGDKVEDFKLHDVSDVLKYYLEDGSFIAIRPSGTEPKCKCYLSVKDTSMEKAKEKCEGFITYVRSMMQ